MPKPLSLEQRLQKSIAAATPAAPNLHPRRPAPPIEIEALPDLQEVVASPADRVKIMRLVTDSLEYQAAEAEVRKKREPVTKALKELLQNLGADKFMCDGNRVVTYETTRKSLSKEKLMGAGVSITLLNACTVETVSLALKITAPGAVDDND
jgi:hypothetical protein